MNAHLVAIPSLGTLTARGLAASDLEDLLVRKQRRQVMETEMEMRDIVDVDRKEINSTQPSAIK